MLEFEKEAPDKSKAAIERALSIDPTIPAYYGMLSRIQVYFREFEMALHTANTGLEYDPANESCLNAKGDALTKLGRKEEANAVFNDSLAEDPENDQTFAFLGYSLLQQGKHKEALTHFKQALALNPGNELAIEGIKLAIKAKFFLYRWLMNLNFALTKLPGRVQMFLVVGIYFLYQFLNRMAHKNPELEPFIQPFLFIYLIFAFSSWFLTPLANFALQLHPFGKYALSQLERSTSKWVGSLLGLSLMCGVSRLYFQESFPTFPSIYFLFMAIAAAAAGLMTWEKHRKKMRIYAMGLAFVGMIALINELLTHDWGLFSFLFIGGTIGLQFYANILLAKR